MVAGQRRWCPCRPPVVHYPYQNWYFLPGPAGPGVLVLKLPLVFVFVVFPLCGHGRGLRFPSRAALVAAAFFSVVLLRSGEKGEEEPGEGAGAGGPSGFGVPVPAEPVPPLLVPSRAAAVGAASSLAPRSGFARTRASARGSFAARRGADAAVVQSGM